jgi:hypothetical protein
LGFLLERVEYINCLLKLGDIENTISWSRDNYVGFRVKPGARLGLEL